MKKTNSMKTIVLLAILLITIIGFFMPWVKLSLLGASESYTAWNIGSLLQDVGQFSEEGSASAWGVLLIIVSVIDLLLLVINGIRILIGSGSSTPCSGMAFTFIACTILSIIISSKCSGSYGIASITPWPILCALFGLVGTLSTRMMPD